jgi:hypothetical protein
MHLATVFKTFAALCKKMGKHFGSNGAVMMYETRQFVPGKEQKHRQHLHELTLYNGFSLPEEEKD